MPATLQILNRRIQIWPLIIAILICESAGIIGSIFTAQSVNSWYQQLNKPGFTPPNWLFGPVWTTLYLLMGISVYLVWEKRKFAKSTRTAMVLFFIQLMLNSLWSFTFFGMQAPLIGLINILLLLIFIALTMTWFYRISKPAFLLLIPYLLWVLYATALNYAIFQLN